MIGEEERQVDIASLAPKNEMANRLGSMLSGAASVLKFEDDDFLKKWSGPMLIGPFVPAVFAGIVIVTGELVLNTPGQGTCNFPIDLFIQAAIGVCYLFLIVYSWVFLGDTVTLKSEWLDINRKVLVPFTSMKWLMAIYIIIGFTSFIVWAVGTTLLKLAALCIYTSPKLYEYTLFLVAIYWLGFVIVIIFLIKLVYGDKIAAFVKDNARAPTANELEERIFRKKFSEFDRDRTSTISKEDFAPLLVGLGVYIPDAEQGTLLRTMDPENTGTIQFDVMYAWFLKLNAQAGDSDAMDAAGSGPPP